MATKSAAAPNLTGKSRFNWVRVLAGDAYTRPAPAFLYLLY